MEQCAESVVACHTLHKRHQQHIMVNGKVGFFEYRGNLKLVWRDLVVAGLARNAKFEGLNLKVFHERLHTLRDGAEIVVVHLLVLCRVVSHERAARKHEVGAGCIQSFVNEEVLLFPSEVGCNLLHFGVEVVANVRCRNVYGVEGSQQRSLVVECFVYDMKTVGIQSVSSIMKTGDVGSQAE